MGRRQAILPTDVDRDDLEWELGPILHGMDGVEVIDQAEPSAFYGWVVRADGVAASVYLPEVGGSAEVRVASDSDELLDRVVGILTGDPSPLAGVEPMFGAAVDGTAPF